MIGTITNVVTIILGSAIGSFFKNQFSPKYQSALFTAIGGCALAVGISTLISSINSGGYIVLLIINMSIGCLIGTYFSLHDKFLKISERLKAGHNLGEGLVTAVLLYCIGALSILGPVQSALHGDNTMLFTNASLDFITSIALASVYGFGISLSAIAILAFQGSIFLCAYLAEKSIPEYIMSNVTMAGGVLIIFSSISLLNIRSIKTTDYLPAIFVAIFTSWIAHILLS